MVLLKRLARPRTPLSFAPRTSRITLTPGLGGFRTGTLEDRWILSRFNRAARDVNESLEIYRFDEAANRIYDFFWGEFCDWYLELIKPRFLIIGSLDGS